MADETQDQKNTEEVDAPETEEQREDADPTLVDSISDLRDSFRDFAVAISEQRADADVEDGPMKAVQDAMAQFAEKMDGVKSQADAMYEKHDQMKGQLDALYTDLMNKNNEDAMEEEQKNDSAPEDRADAAPSMTEKDMLAWHKERKSLEAVAGSYRIDGADDLDNAGLKAAIVTEHFGEDRVDGASPAEVDGMFTALQAIRAKRDDSYQEVAQAVTKSRQDGGEKSAQEKYRDRLMNAGRRQDSGGDVVEKLRALLSE